MAGDNRLMQAWLEDYHRRTQEGPAHPDDVARARTARAFARRRPLRDQGPLTRLMLDLLGTDSMRTHPRRLEIIEQAIALDEALGLDGWIAPGKEGR